MADEAVDLTGGNVQRQIVYGLLLAVALGQMLNVQHMLSSLNVFSTMSVLTNQWQPVSYHMTQRHKQYPPRRKCKVFFKGGRIIAVGLTTVNDNVFPFRKLRKN